MMTPNYFLFFIACYGICFGFMFKAKWFHKRHPFFDAMFKCAYCTGFWSGMFAWLFLFGPFTNFSQGNFAWVLLSLVGHMFASSAFCYIADTAVQRLEELKIVLTSSHQAVVEYEDEISEEDEEDEEDVLEEDEYADLSPLERLRLQAQKKAEENG